MAVEIRPVQNARDLKEFVFFPWQIYRGDRCWVPPLINDRLARLDRERGPFWQTMEGEFWLARREGNVVGTLAAMIPRAAESERPGYFGFFECLEDPQIAGGLFDQAADWLKARGAAWMRGPYNPSADEEPGILVEGFDTRPALMEGHNPPYYPGLLEAHGFTKQNDLLARLKVIPSGTTSLQTLAPSRLWAVADRVARRPDLTIRSLRPDHWEEDIRLAWQIFNEALRPLPDHREVPWEEFLALANSFKTILKADLALMAEIEGKPVGYALALPDFNEALQAANGKLDLPGLLRVWWRSRRLSRLSFKILMILPEYHGRGVEAVLIERMARAVLRRGYREVDMSLTGEENDKSTRFQENLGMKVYRRYRIYQKGLL
jgi:GNAT superfamily N-acetyltransferase